MNESTKVARTTALLYGVGTVSNGIKDTGFNLFLLFFYTQVAGLSSGLAGTAILCALIIDAVSDPLIGYLSDQSHSVGASTSVYVLCGNPYGARLFLPIHTTRHPH